MLFSLVTPCLRHCCCCSLFTLSGSLQVGTGTGQAGRGTLCLSPSLPNPCLAPISPEFCGCALHDGAACLPCWLVRSGGLALLFFPMVFKNLYVFGFIRILFVCLLPTLHCIASSTVVQVHLLMLICAGSEDVPRLKLICPGPL